MTKIDTSGWKEFKLSDVFLMNNTKSIVQKNIMPDSGDIAYVTAQAGNNGVLTYINCHDEWLDDGNCIMIGGKTLTFSYQSKPFCSNDSHNIALYLKDKAIASEMHYLFLITALRSALYQKYSWGDSISMKRIKNDTFMLPADADGNPDWEYIDKYMSKVMSEAKTSLENLNHVDGGKLVDVSEWKEFVFGDLFDLQGIKQAKSQQMIPTVESPDETSCVPYVVQSRYNNMVSRYVDRQWLIDHNEPPVEGNALALGVTLNACSYQPEEFGASQIITARSPYLTVHNGFFIASVVRKFIEQFDYKEKPGIEKYKALVIKLPVGIDGSPDWAYMDKYMRDIMEKAETDLTTMQLAIR